jgi:hypothetical protein
MRSSIHCKMAGVAAGAMLCAAISGCANVYGLADYKDIGGTGSGINRFPSAQNTDAFGLKAISQTAAQNLPQGLFFDSRSGEIFGSPSASATGVYKLIVSVKDGASASSQTVYLLITPSTSNAGSVQPSTSAGAGKTMFYATALMQHILLEPNIPTAFAPIGAGGGTFPYTYSAANLPRGLSINSTNGVISGLASADAVVAEATVTIQDSSTPPQRQPVNLSIQVSMISAADANGALAPRVNASMLVIPAETPVLFRAVGVNDNNAQFSVSAVGAATPNDGAPASSDGGVIDRMYNQALVACMLFKNQQSQAIFASDEASSTGDLLLTALPTILLATQTKSSAGLIASALVTLFPTQIKTLLSDVPGLGSVGGLGGVTSSAKDFTLTRNYLDMVHTAFSTQQVESDLQDDAVKDTILEEYRVGLEQACVSPTGLQSAASGPLPLPSSLFGPSLSFSASLGGAGAQPSQTAATTAAPQAKTP